MKSRRENKPIKGRGDVPDVEDIGRRIIPIAKVNNKIKMTVHGKSGSGKTTLACTFPGPILLADVNDHGTDSVSDQKHVQLLPVETWHDFEHLYWYLKKHSDKYKTVIIDTVTQLQELAIKLVLAEAHKDPDQQVTWGTMTKREWGQVSTMLKTWIMNYRDLPMNVIFIAQERAFNLGDEEDDGGQITPEVGPRVMPSVGSTLNASVDIIVSTFIRERMIETKREGKKVRKRKVEYCVRVGPHAVYTTKFRKPKNVEMPQTIVDPTYRKLMEARDGE